MAARIVPFRLSRESERDLRNALGRFATGVAVLTTKTGSGRREGLTVNSFSAVSLEPPLILWSLRRDTRSFAAFAGAGHFAVNVLSLEQRALSHHFATPKTDKFAGLAFESGLGGSPVLAGCLAVFECARERSIEAGDHVILIGRVVALAHRAGEPLIFSGGAYGTFSAIEASGGPIDATMRGSAGGRVRSPG